MEEFVVFQKFASREDAAQVIQLLQEYLIPIECYEEVDRYFRIEMGDLPSLTGFYLKLRPTDFERARLILQKESSIWIADIPKEYYLFSFSNQELRQIIEKPDEWNEADYLLAKKILQERGLEISEKEEKMLKEKRLARLSEPVSASFFLILIGFLLSPFIFGVFVGWQLLTSQKILPNGSSIYTYDSKSRTLGKWILLFFVCFWLCLFLVASIKELRN